MNGERLRVLLVRTGLVLSVLLALGVFTAMLVSPKYRYPAGVYELLQKKNAKLPPVVREGLSRQADPRAKK